MKARKWVLLGVIAVLLCLIWGNSLMTGTASGQLSGSLAQLLGRLFPFFSPANPNGGYLLRKCAHFAEFFLLGGSLLALFSHLQHRPGIAALLSIGCGSTVACIDECIQRFVPGRYGCIQDVLLDCSGVVTGTLVLLLMLWFFKLKKRAD